MATIGLRDVHYALLQDDPMPPGRATYSDPVFVRGAISADVNPNTATATLFADDGPFDTAATLGEISLELNLADIPPEHQAILLGHSFENGILRRRGGDVPPWLAIGFKTLKSNGAYRFVWLGKGKFAVPQETYNTRADSIEFQTPTISGAFVKRDSDDEWQRSAEEDSPNFNPSYTSTWFLNPITVAGTFGTGTFGDVQTTISGLPGSEGSIINISVSDSIVVGMETSEWTTTTLNVVLAQDQTYSRLAMQNLLDRANAPAPGQLNRRLTILTAADLVAAADNTMSITLALAD